MTRKDFELIAATIRNLDNADHLNKRIIAERFANSLECSNPRFNRERFVTAATKEN
jgi:hypothetical protein